MLTRNFHAPCVPSLAGKDMCLERNHNERSTFLVNLLAAGAFAYTYIFLARNAVSFFLLNGTVHCKSLMEIYKLFDLSLIVTISLIVLQDGK